MKRGGVRALSLPSLPPLLSPSPHSLSASVHVPHPWYHTTSALCIHCLMNLIVHFVVPLTLQPTLPRQSLPPLPLPPFPFHATPGFAFAITAALTCLAGIGSAFAPSFPSLLLLRAAVGVGLGGAPVVFSLFLEFVPARGRGFWSLALSAFWTVGSMAEAALAWVSHSDCHNERSAATAPMPLVRILNQ